MYHQYRCFIPVATAILLSLASITYGQVIFVNDNAPPGGNGQTWATAYQHLQQGLETANPGPQIWVAVRTRL